MKRFLIAMLLAWLGGALFAQNQPSLDALTRGILSDLDKSTLQTGILLQQAPMWANPFRYNGTALHDSNAVSASTFGRLYGQLRAAAVGQSVLPAPSIYLDELARLRRQRSDTVLLALMHLQFEYIVSEAFTQGLLTWGSDQKAYDVAGRNQSPYRRDTTFVFAALIGEVTRHEVVFQLPSRLMFQNFAQPAADVEVDFADGQGWRVLRPDECVRVNYTKAGQKDIRLRLRQSNQIWQAHSHVEVPMEAAAERYSDNPDEIVDLAGTKLNFFFDCEDHKLRKPLIVVEGFGGDMVNYDKMNELIDIDISPNYQLRDFLDTEGYDLIWVDWTDSNARIQDNAAALQAAIEYINVRKHAGGSSEPNTMICASMGGLIGKYCLLNMHNIQGKDAEVERFFTYDSPLKGANFPVGIQLLVRDLLNLSSSTASDPNIQLALQLLDGYSATQMLRQKAVIDASGNLTLSSAGFDALQTEIDALSAIKPLTEITRHIALANGAGTGTTQESVTSAVVSTYSQQSEFNQEHVTMNVRIADVLVDELMPHPTAEVLGSALTAGQTYNFGKAFSTLVPGGILSTPRQILQNLVIQNGAQLWINRKDRIAYTSNMDNPQNSRPQAFFVTVPGDRCEASQKVVVTIEDGGKLIVGDNEDSPENTGGLYFTSASELYAYGANPIILEDNAELVFAKDSRIELKTGVELLAKTDVFMAATESTFNMEGDSKVIFESTGDFRLDNTSIEVPEGSEIALLNGTSLSVTGQTSVLRIHTGATLRLSGESVANIGPNSTLILDPGSIVILESPESQIRIEGTLVYNGDFNFSGLGHFRFAATHTLEFGPNAAHFSLTGAEPYHRFIYMEDGATLHIPDDINLLLDKGGVEYAGGAAIKLGTGSDATCTFVKFYGGGGSPCLYGPDRPGDIALGDCRFEQVLQPMQFQGGLGNNPFNMENSIDVQRTQFSGYSLGAYIGARQGVAFTDCVFDGCGTGAAAGYALASDGNFFTLMRACQISGHSTGAPASNISANDVMTDPTLRQGVDLNGGFLFWMDGGQIDHCDIGVGNRALGDPAHVPANVILTNKATLDGCTAGLSMEGDATRGLVVASCARITWNVFGISGSDITLLIDPTLMTSTPSFTPKPNTFLADLWQPQLPVDYTDQCRTFIHAARSLTEGDYSGAERQYVIHASGDSLVKIQPNPASGETTVLLPQGRCQVLVFDPIGRLVYAAQAENNCRIETGAWQQGLYIVEVKGSKTAFSSRAKLIVQN